MAQFDFEKVRAVEDQLSGNAFGFVAIEWRLEPRGREGAQVRVYRVRTEEKVGDTNVAFAETPAAAMDQWIESCRGRVHERKAAADVEATAAAEAESVLDKEFPK